MHSGNNPARAKNVRNFEIIEKSYFKEVEEQSMLSARRTFRFYQIVVGTLVRKMRRRDKTLLPLLLGLSFAVLCSGGCGQTAKPITSSAEGTVYSYFGGPFSVAGSDLAKSSSTFDHTANQVAVSAFINTQTAQVPTAIIEGPFLTADTGFLSITENFATTSSGVIAAQNPPLTGAWAVEIPGAGALANLLSVNGANAGQVSVSAAPLAMAENTACPNFPKPVSFLYVTVPNATLTADTADYGGANISSQGSAVTFHTQPYLIGPLEQTASTVTGGCSNTTLGALTAYPLNSFAVSSNLELVSIGTSGLLVSSFSSNNSGSLGAFGGGTGVIGVAAPAAPVNVSAVVGAQYNGFFYAPSNKVVETYDITVLASAYGDDNATSPACSALQSSLVANNGQGAGTVPVLPSANSLYGGEFLTTTAAGAANDPTAASGSENCDVVIDLGSQDSTNNGLFPNATLFIGSNFPPYSTSNPWNCPNTGSSCAVSFPAAAVVGTVQGQYVILVEASAASIPAAQLPNNFGSPAPQPLGIYLFQKKQ
jgi:hypothetical protein